MKSTCEKLCALKERLLRKKNCRVMIMGLGSVGCYLLDYLLSLSDEKLEVVVVGRNHAKMEEAVNAASVSALIRGRLKSRVKIISGVDFSSEAQIKSCLKKNGADIIVNTSRAYPALKYGSISWPRLRSYGIWSPLAISLAKNISSAAAAAAPNAILINASYSDAVIPWLKSAGLPFPDFGSGNVNHLVPRIKLSAAKIIGAKDFWNVEVVFATAHFHDVAISKEGQTEGVSQLIEIRYKGKTLFSCKAKKTENAFSEKKIFSLCKIPMPTDARRNMMNASSNFEIIKAILLCIREQKKSLVHIPGAFGEIGGYPVFIDGEGEKPKAYIDQSVFLLDEMRRKNRESIFLDGIEDVKDGTLFYTDALLEKTKREFGCSLPKAVAFSQIEKVAQKIICEVIERA